MGETRKLYIKSYGCQMNVYDAQRIVDGLARDGFVETAEPGGADLIILNTCNIRERAVEKVYSELGRVRRIKADAAREGRDVLVAVAGCVAQAEGNEIARRAPVVDIVVGPQSIHRLPELLSRAGNGKTVVDTEFPLDGKFDHLAPPSRDATRARGVTAFVTVQEGCDKFCTFCVVPYTRGVEVSRPVGKIVDEVERLAEAGVVEVTLIGQNVNAYHGLDHKGRSASLADLLSRAAEIPGIERLRYTTSHPRDMSDDLISAHRDFEKLMPNLHLPVQSGSDRVLQVMNRGHDRELYLSIIERARAARPDIAVSSDFIVGFPGETEDDFTATFDLIERVRFAQAYAFKYSPRPGTPAAEMEQIDEAVKADRLARLQGLLERQQRAFNRSLVGHTLDVLFDKPGRLAGQIVGRAPYLQPVQVNAPQDRIGTIAAVRIVEAGAKSLVGEIVAAAGARKHRSAELAAGGRLMRNPDTRNAVSAKDRDSPARIVVAFDDNRLASTLFGRYGENLALIERRLNVVADHRGNHVTLEGEKIACEQARLVLTSLYEQLRGGHEIGTGDIEGAIRQVVAQASLFEADGGAAAAHGRFEEIKLRKRTVRARTPVQDAYLRALKRHSLVLATGPAGTGKTWLAVAHAVHLFERREIDKIILSRPAVEAGERLGFLPGDMREKVDPYLRPIYDAFYDVMDRGMVERALQSGEIEIAPLAFMRGRTLANAAVILDEAQNTTSMQMKMFLTRLGENSRMIVTGDLSQTDLPPGQTSGLNEAVELLAKIEDIAHIAFTSADVVRHELVSRIVNAYDAAAAKAKAKKERKA